MYVAMIIANDEPDEGVYVVLGPFEDEAVAQKEGDAFAEYLDDEYPDHEWDVDVQPTRTYEEALINEGKAREWVERQIRDNPEFFNHR